MSKYSSLQKYCNSHNMLTNNTKYYSNYSPIYKHVTSEMKLYPMHIMHTIKKPKDIKAFNSDTDTKYINSKCQSCNN